MIFYLNSALLGAGLAMDAFSVSMADGLNHPDMRFKDMAGIAGVFAGFQALMPMLGWILVHTAVTYFSFLAKFVPYIAFALLCFLGVKMLIEGLRRSKKEENPAVKLKAGTLLLQGVATSIDALSVGFTIADYDLKMAVIASLIISVVTFTLCMGGVAIGRRFGTRLSKYAEVLGGSILIFIGLEILLKSLIGW